MLEKQNSRIAEVETELYIHQLTDQIAAFQYSFKLDHLSTSSFFRFEKQDIFP